MNNIKLHDLPDLSAWRHVELLTVKQAALLWAGVDPVFCKSIYDLAKTSREQYRIAYTFQQAILSGICTGTLSANDIYVFDRNDDSPFPEPIPYTESILPSINDIDPSCTTVKTISITSWATKKDFLSIRQIAAIKERQEATTKFEVNQSIKNQQATTVVHQIAYQSKHDNPSMEVLHEISRQVWDKVDKGGAPPKALKIDDLIIEEYVKRTGVKPSANIIRQINSIARPPIFKNQGKQENS